MTRASAALRLLYCLSLVTWIFPAMMVGASGWIGLATGGGLMPGLAALIVLLSLVLVRCYQVARHADALNARLEHRTPRVLRALSVACMAIGTSAALGMFFMAPLARVVFGGVRTESGVELFVLGLVLWALSHFGPLGWALFELSRLIGGPGETRPRGAFFSAPGMAGLAVTALIVGGAAFSLERYAGEPCGMRQMSDCLPGEAVESVVRTAVVSESAHVRLESNVSEVGYERRALFGRGQIIGVESPAASLAAAGFRARTDAQGPVGVRIEASERDGTLTFTMEVVDDGQRIARNVYSRRGGYRLEQQAGGVYRVVYQVSARAEPILPPIAGRDLGAWKDERARDRNYNLDRMFLFARKVMRHPVEAALDARSAEAEAKLVQSSLAEEPTTSAEIEAKQHGTKENFSRCRTLVVTRDLSVSSVNASGQIAPLREIRFKQAPQEAVAELMHPYDRLQCGDAVFATGYDRAVRTLRIRKYSALGEPLYALRVKLPGLPEELEKAAWLALDSVGDDGALLSFEMRAWEARSGALFFVRKERYEVRLPERRP